MSKYLPKLKSDKIDAKRLMKRWNIDGVDLSLMIEDGLPAYETGGGIRISKGSVTDGLTRIDPRPRGISIPLGLETRIKNKPTSIIFIKSDIEKFESKHPEISQTTLGANDARELGRLKREKIKWDDSIAAAVNIGFFCSKLDHPIKRDELKDKIYFNGYKDPPDTTIEKIWKAIPETLKKKAGRPSKK